MTAEKIWADLGPSLSEAPINPNENVFTLVVQADDYDAVMARLAEAERDAERYRWVRRSGGDADIVNALYGADLDAAIDVFLKGAE